MESLHYDRSPSVGIKLIRSLLLPPGWLYRVVADLRRATAKQPAKASAPVISVGNLTTGGTGKTPVVMMLAERLAGDGRRVAILSRGYRSAHEKQSVVFQAIEADDTQLRDCGDEVLMMAHRLPSLIFGVGRDRLRNARTIASRYQPAVYILDDGFQHLSIHRDLNVVTVDASRGFGNGMTLPGGPLRESISALRHADAVLLTRTETAHDSDVAALESQIGHHVDPKKIFRLRTRLASVRDLATGESANEVPSSVWLFSGIGNPGAFRRLIEGDANCQIVGETRFADHHRFSADEIASLQRIVSGNIADALVTTAKDAARLRRERFRPNDCFIAEIDLEFGARADIFWGLVQRCVAGAEV